MKTVYTLSDVAKELGVSRQLVAMWVKRYSNAPEPDLRTASRTPLWFSLDSWRSWVKPEDQRAARGRERRIERLRRELAELEGTESRN